MSNEQPPAAMTPADDQANWWSEGAQPDIKSIRLRLYVSGMTPRSLRAIGRVREITREFAMSSEQVEIIDIYQFPHLAAAHQVIASPTLVRIEPAPVLRIVGELSDREQVLKSLGIDQKT